MPTARFVKLNPDYNTADNPEYNKSKVTLKNFNSNQHLDTDNSAVFEMPQSSSNPYKTFENSVVFKGIPSLDLPEGHLKTVDHDKV